MIKEAFEYGYMLGMQKEATFSVADLSIPMLALMGAVPLIGGAGTGYVHGNIAKKDYGVKAKHLLAEREAEIKRERNRKLREDIKRLMKQKNINSNEFDYGDLNLEI